VLGHRRGVDRDERFLSARTMPVQRARHKLLSGSRLARDEHRSARLREPPDRAEHLLHRGCLAENLLRLEHGLHGLRLAPALVERPPDESRRETQAVETVLEPKEILGQAPAMQEVFRAIGRLSQSSATVLITGESGTGKELVARALHRHSARSPKPFIAINTAAMPKDLLESALFGHERGSFTGAQQQRRGRFEQAEGGTLFLDEIGDMPAE